MTTTTTEAFETGLRAEFEAWAKERGHPLCDVIPKYGPASSMSDTTLRFSDIAWEAYRAATERAAKLERPTMLSADDMADLELLNEVFNDGESWGLPKERMKRLAELGLVRWHGVTRYSITSFGRYCLSEFELPLSTLEEYNAKAYAEMLERNGIDAAAIRASSEKGDCDV